MEQSRTPRKAPKSRKSSNKIYEITDNDVTYTLITASRGGLRSLYSNKKTANAVTDPNRSSATGMLSKNNIPQLSENASQTDGNGQKRTETDGRFALRKDVSWSELAEKLAIRPTCPFSSVFVRFRPFSSV